MKYLITELSTVRTSEVLGSDNASRGTWYMLSCYCADQENGGTIKGCIGWHSELWKQLCGVTREEIDAANLLLKWVGHDLVVFGYPEEQERKFQAKRHAGSIGGKKKAENQAKQLALDELLIDPERAAAGETGKPLAIKGYGDINDTRLNLVDVACAVTGERKKLGMNYWRTALEKIGPEQFRAQLVTLWGEMNAGEKPPNPAATLTLRIKKLVERYEERNGK